MSKHEREPQCVLGNGAYPPDCPLNNQSAKITADLGSDFDPFQSRLGVIFGDAFNKDVTVADVSRAMSSCIKERQNGQ